MILMRIRSKIRHRKVEIKILFPVIKVKDKATNAEHIVGTDIHDQLKIKDGRTISYYNLQNGEGTMFGDYQFEGNYNNYEGVTIDFVSFEELTEIYKKQCIAEVEAEKIRQELLRKLLNKKVDAHSEIIADQ